MFARLARSPPQTFVFISCFSANTLTRAPLVITLLLLVFIAAFIAFIGAMIARRELG